MTRTASDPDLYRRLDTVQEAIRQQQQGLLQGLFNPYVYPPCDYATTGNVDLTAVFTSITDAQVGAPTPAALNGMRILVWQQTNTVDNGIYEIGTDFYLHRVADMFSGADVKGGARVFVRSGYSFGNRDFFIIGQDKIIGINPMTISPPRGTVIDEQKIRGTDAAYTIPAAGTMTNMLRNNTTGAIWQAAYTPPVDCYWDCFGSVYCYNPQAAYAYIYCRLQLNVNDVDGISSYQEIAGGQHASVITYHGRNTRYNFKLAAGVAYTCTLQCYTSIAGPQFYHNTQGANDDGSILITQARVR